MPTTIGNLWIPAIWTQALRERMATFPALWNAGIVTRADLFDQIAAGSGISANVPFLNDITDQGDEVQVENQAPANDNIQPGATQVFPIMNRVKKNSSTALSAQLSGVDPMAAIIDQMTDNRLKNRQKTLIAQLRGLFSSAGAGVGGAGYVPGALDPVKLTYNGQEPFIENGPAAGVGNQFVVQVAVAPVLEAGNIGGIALLRFLAVSNHALGHKVRVVHIPSLHARPHQARAGEYRNVAIGRDRPGQFGRHLEALEIQGVQFLQPGLDIRVNQQAALFEQIFQFTHQRRAINEHVRREQVWDRTRFILGVNGTKWVGNAANPNNGPSNAELQVPGNWQLVFQTANRVGAVCIRTNG